MTFPSVAEVERVATIADPILRNFQITQCYSEISHAFRSLSGAHANWCTFATWASKQAGQTIRGEDFVRHFQDKFRSAPEIADALGRIVAAGRMLSLHWDVSALAGRIAPMLSPAAAFARASDAVARGNRKVFEEIGREFARYLAAFSSDTAYDVEKVSRFCAELRAGDPPDGQQLLREAFSAYSEARFHAEPDAKAELHFHANLLAGFHEQTRLQPEIAEALNASLDAEQVKRSILHVLLPGAWLRMRYNVARMLGRKLPLDAALDHLLAAVQRQIREVITEHLMTLHLPREVLRLGRDLPGGFPEPLGQIANAQLKELLKRVDSTPDSVTESGARDWAHFEDRMHFITDFFRCYHERSELFDAPFPKGRRHEGTKAPRN